MKLLTPLAPLVVLIVAAATTSGYSQSRSISGNGFDSGGINVTPKDTVTKTTKTVTTIQFIAVSPERMWKSSDAKQKPILGSLLAFAREKESGKVSIVEADKVRLLVGKKDFTLPMTKLSLDDQAYIQNLVDSARIAGKLLERAEPEAEKEKEKAKGKAGAAPSSAEDDRAEGARAEKQK